MQRRDALKYCAMLAGTVQGREFLASWLPAGEDTSRPAHPMDMGAASASLPSGESKHYQPGFFKPAEFETVRVLTEIILPADGNPGAQEAGVPQFIDFVVAGAAEFMPSLQQEWTQGLISLDEESNRRFDRPFREASPYDQTALLTEMSLPEREPKASHPGFSFYKLVKEMSVEGFYSSRVGLLDVLEYKGLAYLSGFPGCTHPEHQKA